MEEKVYRQSRLCRLMGNPIAFAVVDALNQNKELSPSEIARTVGRSVSRVSHVLASLRLAEVVRYDTDGVGPAGRGSEICNNFESSFQAIPAAGKGSRKPGPSVGAYGIRPFLGSGLHRHDSRAVAVLCNQRHLRTCAIEQTCGFKVGGRQKFKRREATPNRYAESEGTMDDVAQRLSRYVGHLAEGALRFRNELSVGTEAPDFELQALDGGAFRLSDYRGRSNVVLIFGSFTCGSTVTQLRAGNPSLGSLYRRFKRKGFEFSLVYSVEMHSGEHVPRPTTFEQRRQHAQRLKKEEKVPFPIIVDGIGNDVRRLYHALTNPAFVIDRDGVLVYKSSWTWAPDLERALGDILAWERAEARNEMVGMCYSEKLIGLTRNRKISAQVHRRAGPEAVETFKALLRQEGTKG